MIVSLFCILDITRNSPDLAILLLEHMIDDILNPKTYENYVRVVNLPSPNSPCPKGKYLVNSGWGRENLDSTPFSTHRLHAVFQECLPLHKCGIDPKEPFLCIGDLFQPLNGACKGDSGGNNPVQIISHIADTVLFCTIY